MSERKWKCGACNERHHFEEACDTSTLIQTSVDRKDRIQSDNLMAFSIGVAVGLFLVALF